MVLIIAGGAMQMAGFTLVAWELARIQRREFGEPEVLSRWRGRFRRWTGRTRTATGSARVTAKGEVRARGKARAAPGETFVERVNALEENFGHLDREVAEDRATAERGRDQLLDLLDLTRGEFKEQRHADERDRKAFLKTSVALQSWGTALFILGTVLGVVGSVS